MKAWHLMQASPVVLHARMCIAEAVAALLDGEVSTAPVVDEGGVLLGMLRESDLFTRNAELAAADLPLLDDEHVPPDCLRAISAGRWGQTRIESIYHPEAPRIDAHTDAAEAVWHLIRNGHEVLPVVEQGRLVGVIWRTRVARFMARAL